MVVEHSASTTVTNLTNEVDLETDLVMSHKLADNNEDWNQLE
jgi:hypothetical protein